VVLPVARTALRVYFGSGKIARAIAPKRTHSYLLADLDRETFSGLA
jgi:hypothetical protein